MSDKLFYPAMAILALAMIALSLVWPQGIGARSPGLFGKAIELPDVVRMERERIQREAEKKAEAAVKAKEKSDLQAAEAAESAAAQ